MQHEFHGWFYASGNSKLYKKVLVVVWMYLGFQTTICKLQGFKKLITWLKISFQLLKAALSLILKLNEWFSQTPWNVAMKKFCCLTVVLNPSKNVEQKLTMHLNANSMESSYRSWELKFILFSWSNSDGPELFRYNSIGDSCEYFLNVLLVRGVKKLKNPLPNWSSALRQMLHRRRSKVSIQTVRDGWGEQ